LPYGIRLRVRGPRACFTRPEMKVERVSYDVMTPSAARGILEAIHWKPAIRWVVEEIHVLKPIRFQSLRRNEVGAKVSAAKAKTAMNRGSLENLHMVVEENRQQRATTHLVDVDYVIVARFEMTARAGAEDNEAKHLSMFNRRAGAGQCFHQPCLGAREFVADFELLAPDAPLPQAEQAHQTPELGFGTTRSLGFMLWDIEHQARGRPSLFFDAKLVEGVLSVPAPGATEIRQ